MSRASKSKKGLFADASDPTQLLRWQYNPTTTRESKSVGWAEASIPGGDDELGTFGAGKSLKLDIELFFNAVGEQPSDLPVGFERFDNASFHVEAAIAFLYRFTERPPDHPRNARPARSPGVMLLSMGHARFPGYISERLQGVALPALPVRIEDMEVERTAFHPHSMITLQATIKLQLKRHVGFPR